MLSEKTGSPGVSWVLSSGPPPRCNPSKVVTMSSGGSAWTSSLRIFSGNCTLDAVRSDSSCSIRARRFKFSSTSCSGEMARASGIGSTALTMLSAPLSLLSWCDERSVYIVRRPFIFTTLRVQLSASPRRIHPSHGIRLEHLIFRREHCTQLRGAL
jgi:hypothetical protein